MKWIYLINLVTIAVVIATVKPAWAISYVKGDINLDGIVSDIDYRQLLAAFSLVDGLITYPRADIKADGRLNILDYNSWIQTFNARPWMPTNGVTKLYFQQWSGDPSEVTYLSDAYKAFTGTENALQGYNLSWKNQEIKAKYFETTTPPMPGVGDAYYPIHYTDVASDESNFVHTSDPAGLYFYRGNGAPNRYVIYWRGDQRISQFTDGTYTLYKCDGCAPIYPMVWDQQWKNLPWQSIGNYQASAFPNGKWLMATDTGISNLDLNGTNVTCYLVKSGIGGQANQYYSLPVCNRWDWLPASNKVMVQAVTLKALTQVNPPSPKVNDWYANVNYEIDVRLDVPAAVTKVEAILYGYTTDPLVVNGKTTEQMQGTFTERGRYTLPPYVGGAGGTLNLRRPIMANVYTQDGSIYVESPVFRIAVTDTDGLVQEYPGGLVNGYLSVHPNQRLENRFWSGYAMNPGSIGWQTAAVNLFREWQSQGFNSVFLDNWAARHFAPENNIFETKSEEFGNYWNGYSGIDPTTQALDRMGTALSTALPQMSFIGNGLNIANGDVGIRAMQSIQGGMYETCMHHSLLGIYKDQDLQNLMTFMDTFLAAGKKLVCFAGFDFSSPNANPFEPKERIYSLAGYLLTAQNKISGNSYYGEVAYPQSWGKQINQLPEFFIDLGDPTGVRQNLGNFVYKRAFSQGLVFVNGGGSATDITVSGDYRNVNIEGNQIQRNSAGQVIAANPGTLKYTDLTNGSVLTLPKYSGAILVK